MGGSGAFVLVRHHDQHDQADDAQQTERAEPDGMSLALRVLTATPDEYRHANKRNDEPDALRSVLCHRPTGDLQQDTNTDAYIGVSFVLREHTLMVND